MLFNSRITQIIITIVSIIGYGYFAFAVLTPGQTLDPVGDNLCTGPSDTDCEINFATGGSLSIGDTIGNSPIDHGLLYTDASGNLASDAGFIRNTSTGETAFSTTGQLDGSEIATGQTANGLLRFLGVNDIPFEGNFSKTENGDYNIQMFDAHIDVSSFDAQPPGTLWLEQAGSSIENADDGNIASVYARKLPSALGGSYTTVFELNVDGFEGISGLDSDGSEMVWRASISDGSTFQNELQFSDTNPLEWSWGTNTIWKMPIVQGTAGDTLVLDADNETLIWQAGGGSSDILLDSSTFYSSTSGYVPEDAPDSFIVGNGAGTGFNNAVGGSNFLGQNAGNGATNASFSNFFGHLSGYGATNASFSNFLGNAAGYGATNAASSNFLGYGAGNGATGALNSNFLGQEAGNGATDAADSNFLGYLSGSGAADAANSNFLGQNAGNGATDASNSNFFGNSAGNGATNASNSIFIGAAAGSNDAVDNTAANTTDSCDSITCWSILLGPNTSTGGFSNSITLGGNAINTATNQFMLADSITNVRWRGVEYELPSAQATGTATYLYNDTNGVLSWEDPAITPSDERLKSNITDLDTNILEKINQVRTVSYTLDSDSTNRTQIGFIAQDLENYFPDLVGTKSDGYLGVYYAQMTPVLVQAIRELDLKIENIETFASSVDTSFIDGVRNWLGDVSNQITLIIADTVKARNQICIDDVCMTKDQLRNLLDQNGMTPSAPESSNSDNNSDSPEVPGEPSAEPEPAEDEPVAEESQESADPVVDTGESEPEIVSEEPTAEESAPEPASETVTAE